GDDELGFTQHVEGTAAGHPVHRCDHGLPEVVALGPQVRARVVEHERAREADRAAAALALRPAGELVGPVDVHFAAVDAGAERPLARSGEHRTVDVRVVTQAAPDVAQPLAHLAVEPFVPWGPFHRPPRAAFRFLVLDVFVVAHPPPPRVRASANGSVLPWRSTSVAVSPASRSASRRWPTPYASS